MSKVILGFVVLSLIVILVLLFFIIVFAGALLVFSKKGERQEAGSEVLPETQKVIEQQTR